MKAVMIFLLLTLVVIMAEPGESSPEVEIMPPWCRPPVGCSVSRGKVSGERKTNKLRRYYED